MLDAPRTVQEVTDHLRDLIDADPFLGDLWITGEVLESTISRSGHVFFTMSGGDARIRCILFRMNALRQRTLPSPGSACSAHGRVEIYPTDGTYQFYVDLVEDAGIGLAALEFELLRQQLEAEGLFSEDRKRPLPINPRAIGVVTSGSGAVWHDIQQVIRRRYPFAQLVLCSSAVQGDLAPAELIAALQALVLDGRAQVIIIARGGGAASDLAAFNDENLVRAVFAAPVPIVSAIGHETDWTLLDLVADSRAPTPSAAAELVTPSIAGDLQALTESLESRLGRFERDLTALTMDAVHLGDRLDRYGPTAVLPLLREKHRATQSELTLLASRQFHERRIQIDDTNSKLTTTFALGERHRSDRASRAFDLLQAMSPAKTMERGYAFVEHRQSGRPLQSIGGVAIGDQLRTRLIDGSIDSDVTRVTRTASQ